jgi:hypothetical protein
MYDMQVIDSLPELSQQKAKTADQTVTWCKVASIVTRRADSPRRHSSCEHDTHNASRDSSAPAARESAAKMKNTVNFTSSPPNC